MGPAINIAQCFTGLKTTIWYCSNSHLIIVSYLFCVSVIFDSIVMRFMESEKEDDKKSQVPSMVWLKQVELYDRKVYEWEMRVKKYQMMLAGKFDKEGDNQCRSGGDKQSNGMEDNYEDKAFRALAKYIGMKKSKELVEKEMVLEKLMSSADRFNVEKLMKVTEELQWLRYGHLDKEGKTKYALCMVSAAKESKSILGDIKDVLDKADNWDETATGILQNMILYDLKNKFMDKSLLDILGRVYGKDSSMEENLYVLRKKLQFIFRVNKDCSSESDRSAVAMRMMKLKELVPKMIEAVLEKTKDMANADKIKAVLLEVEAKFNGTKFTETVATIFSLIYNPSAKPDIEGKMMMIKQALMSLRDEDAKQLANYTKEFVSKKLELDSLMVVHILLLSKEELSMECSLKDLAKKVLMKEEGGDDLPCEKSQVGQSRQNQRMSDRKSWDEYEYQGYKQDGYDG